MAMGYPHEWKLLLVHFLVGGLEHLLFFYILAIYNIFSEGLKPPASFCMCFMRVTSPLGAAPLGDPLLDPLGASASSRSAWDGGATMRRRCGSFNQEKNREFTDWLVVSGLEHVFVPFILRMSSSQLTFEGWLNHQPADEKEE